MPCYGAGAQRKSLTSRILSRPVIRIVFMVQTSESSLYLSFSNMTFKYLIRPNLDTQSNLDPTAAAQLWMQNILPLSSQGYTSIWSPAVTSADSGVTWLQAFFKACQGCTVRILSHHRPSAWFQQYLWPVYWHEFAHLRH